METRKLGDLEVVEIGLGCMGMSEFYGPSDEAESLETLHHALSVGETFWDTADMYGSGENERLLAKVLKTQRDRVVLATKFGIERGANGEFVGINGHPDYVAQACDASLTRLGIDHIDLYYQHRVDQSIDIEETVGAMSRLVEVGKVRYLGLSEASASTIRRACEIHPISALQSEYSLWSRDIEGEILDTCRELNVGLVAYSPLGRGFLSGAIQSIDDLAEDDWRRLNPRFQGDNFAKNLTLVQRVNELAKQKGCTGSQLALAWVLAKGENYVPIPGTRRRNRIDENIGAGEVNLTQEELESLDKILDPKSISGTRYPEESMHLVNA